MSDADLLSGWNPALDIPSALSLVPHERVTQWHAVIAVLDSSPRVSELPSLPPLLSELGASYSRLGNAIVIDGATLLAVARQRGFLNGFDEVWLFSRPPEDTKPEAVPLTSDIRLVQEPPGILADWMSDNEGIAGLGDGDGLNFVTFLPELALLWDQPSPGCVV